MSTIISIVAISLTSVLLEALLSEGQTKKYIQGILSLAIILVILTQMVSLIKGSDNIADYFNNASENALSADTEVLNTLETARYNKAIEKINKSLEKEGISNVKISFTYGYNELGKIYIQNIYVDTAGVVINSGHGNINIIDKIIDAVQSEIDIKKEGIIIDGQISNN